MPFGLVEFTKFDVEGQPVVIGGMPDDEGGYAIIAISGHREIGRLHVDPPKRHDPQSLHFFEGEKRRALQSLEQRIRGGEIPL